MHPNARTTPLVRLEIVKLVEAGVPIADLSRRFAISRTTVYKWLRRFRECGSAGLDDRPPIAASFPTKIPAKLQASVKRLRKEKRLLGWQIAVALKMPRSTVGKVLKRLGMARLRDLEPPRIFHRYEYQQPGELVHIDIKKLGRFEVSGHRIHGDRRRKTRNAGHEVVYVNVDDASRRTEAQMYDAENAESAAAFLRYVVAVYARRGVRIQRVMTDNGKVFTSRLFQDVLREIGAVHILTPFYTPRWNGKAERFIQSMLREWAYGVAYRNSSDRAEALPAWLRYYNQDRQHTGINHETPTARWIKLRKQSA